MGMIINPFAVTPPLDVTCSNVFKGGSGSGPEGTVTTDPAAPVVSNGTGSYTYAWVHQSTSSGDTPSISNASIANPTWQAGVEMGTPSTSIWRLTVTDTVTGLQDTVDVTVTMTWLDTDIS